MTSNGSGGFVGFNQSQIDECFIRLKGAYNHADGSISTICGIGKDLSTAWASPEAVEVINSYKTDMKKIMENVEDILVSTADTMSMAYDGWCRTTGCTTHYPGNPQDWFLNLSTYFNYEPVDKFNDIVGVDATQARAYVGYLRDIYAQRLYDDLKNILSIIDECKGFIGGNMHPTLINNVSSLVLKIQNSVSSYVDKFSRSIDDTVSKYEDTAGRITQSFYSNNG